MIATFGAALRIWSTAARRSAPGSERSSSTQVAPCSISSWVASASRSVCESTSPSRQAARSISLSSSAARGSSSTSRTRAVSTLSCGPSGKGIPRVSVKSSTSLTKHPPSPDQELASGAGVGRLHRFLVFPRTLRTRLVAVSLAAILAAVAAFAVAALLLVRSELRGSLDTALRGRAQEVSQLAVSAPAVLSAPGGLESPVSGRQIAVEVLDAHGRILARSLTLGARLLPIGRVARAALAAGHPGYEDTRVSGRSFRLYAAPIAEAGGPASGGVVLVASDTTDISDTIGRIGLALALSGIGAVILAALAAAGLTGLGLRPLRRLVAGAREIERTGDPLRRLPALTGSGSSEIVVLTEVLNRMLASLERSRENERRFLADASHELRTPVTALLGNVEFAARHGADPEVLADLRRDAARLARLVDDLLVLERSGAAQQALEPVDLARLASDVVAAHPDGRVALGTVEPVAVQGEKDALSRALENLIENGLVH